MLTLKPSWSRGAHKKHSGWRTVTLRTRSGEVVALRRATPEDQLLLAEMVRRLSLRTRNLRYLTPLPVDDMTVAREVARMTRGAPDAHLTLVVTREDGTEAIAVGELVRDEQSPEVAEIALLVRDDYQGQGIGKALAGRLADEARRRGITTLTGEMMAENSVVRHVMAGLGQMTSFVIARGEIQMQVRLEPARRAA